MSGGPSVRLLVGAVALAVAVAIGAGVAACQQNDDPPDPCTGAAYAIPAGPVEGTKSSGRSTSTSRKNLDPQRRPVVKTPTPRPAPGRHPHHEIDLDVDLDGC